MVSISKGVVLPVLMDILEIVVLFIVQSLFILEMDCAMLVNLLGGRIYM
jgi:hypothetical protein